MSFVDPMRAIASGRDFVNDAANTIYSRQAAQGLASGNYAQALGALGQAGDMRGVAAVQDRQAAQQQAQSATQEADIAKQVAFSRQASNVLRKALTEGQDPVAAYDSLAPAFQQVGATPEQIQQYRQALAADPANFLTNIERVTADAERKLQIVNFGSGRGASVVDTGTGEEVNRLAPDRLPVISGGVSYDPVTGQPIFDARRPEYIEVEGADGQPQIVAVGPNGASVAFEGQARGPAVQTLSPEEVASLGLQPGVYQRDRDGKINAVSGQGGDRLSAGQQKQVEGYYQEIAGLDNIDAELGRFAGMIESGALNLSPVSNTIGGVRNALGVSDENSRNLAEFRSTLERVRNDSLRLNSGVQTEGDAQRAWKELLDNVNDPRLVQQQLRRIQGINARARQFRQQRINTLEGGSRQRPAQGQGSGQPAPQTRRRDNVGTQENPIRLNEQSPRQSYNNIRSGQYYRDPNGVIRQKQ